MKYFVGNLSPYRNSILREFLSTNKASIKQLKGLIYQQR